jgi:hypothetical protein
MAIACVGYRVVGSGHHQRPPSRPSSLRWG